MYRCLCRHVGRWLEMVSPFCDPVAVLVRAELTYGSHPQVFLYLDPHRWYVYPSKPLPGAS